MHLYSCVCVCVCVCARVCVCLEFEVWYPSLNPLPFRESFLKDFKKGFQTLLFVPLLLSTGLLVKVF